LESERALSHAGAVAEAMRQLGLVRNPTASMKDQLFFVCKHLGITTHIPPSAEALAAAARTARTVAASPRRARSLDTVLATPPPQLMRPRPLLAAATQASSIGGAGSDGVQVGEDSNSRSDGVGNGSDSSEKMPPPERTTWVFEVETRCGDGAFLDALLGRFPLVPGSYPVAGSLWMDFVSGGALVLDNLRGHGPGGDGPRRALSLAGREDLWKPSSRPVEALQVAGSETMAETTAVASAESEAATNRVLPAWRQMQELRRARGCVREVVPLPMALSVAGGDPHKNSGTFL